MSTACYTNRLRVETIARNNKVEYPGKVAQNYQPFAPSCPIDPNFQVLNYTFKSQKCDNKKIKRVSECSN